MGFLSESTLFVKINKIFKQKYTIIFVKHNKTFLGIYTGLQYVYCLKQEGQIHK